MVARSARKLGASQARHEPGRLASSAQTLGRLAGSAAHMAVHVATHGVHVRKTCVATRPRRPQMPFFIDCGVDGPLLRVVFERYFRVQYSDISKTVHFALTAYSVNSAR